MGLLSHPALANLFNEEDFAKVERLQGFLSAKSISTMRNSSLSLYSEPVWRELGRLGLFGIGLSTEEVVSSKAAARSAAMTADVLRDDVYCDVDMAIYVQGIVAVQTLIFNHENSVSRNLIRPVRAGETIMCTAYTDRDPNNPATATACDAGYYLDGQKWLSVNMPNAHFALGTFQDSAGRGKITGLIDLQSRNISRETLHRLGEPGIFSQGSMTLDNAFLPRSHVLESGLSGLRIWNRVISISRVLNAISAVRSLSHLIVKVSTDLAGRSVLNGAFRDQPAFRKWMFSAKARAAVLENSIADTLRMMAEGRFDEPRIAALKAVATKDATALAESARDLAGGGGTLATNEIARICTSLNCHKFSSGAEAPLMALFSASLNRRAAGQTV